MGHQIGIKHRPRRGSLQFWPRKRSKRSYLRIKSYPKINEVKPLGFAGYKAGMTNVLRVDNRKNSISKGEELFTPVTIVEVPKLKVVGFRLYNDNNVLGEEWIKKLGVDMKRKLSLPKKNKDETKKLNELLNYCKKVRLIVSTQPRVVGLKKKPEIFEIQIGGEANDAFNKAKELLGTEISFKDVFKEGELVDSLSVTKGKGFQGSVKRFGIRLLQHKSEKLKRKAASLGAWTPKKVSFRTPQFGQMGYHSRVEYNKEVIKIGEEQDLKIEGGLNKYGNFSKDYVLIKGSLGGSKKRLIIFRKNIRTIKSVEPMQLVSVSTRSHQL